MGKVRVCVRGRRHAVIQGVAFAGDGLGAIARDVGNEPGLTEAGLFVLVALVGDVAGFIAAVDAEKVLDALRDLAVLWIDRLVGGQRLAREGAFLRLFSHGGVTCCGRVEELRHGSYTTSVGECSGRLWCLGRELDGCREMTVAQLHGQWAMARWVRSMFRVAVRVARAA